MHWDTIKCILLIALIYGSAMIAVLWKYWGYKWKWTKKYLAPFDNGKEYVLIGVYGINEWHLRQKIKRLRRRNIIVETRFGVHRSVDVFPDYCDEFY